MNHLKDKKPSRPDIQEILSRMKNRFINETDSDSDDGVKTENVVKTSVVESIAIETPVEKSPDDEIAELMLQLNGQVDEELVASIRSMKKMYENQSVVDSTSLTDNSDETEEGKPRIILTLRPNENKPDSYVSSSNLTDNNLNSPKRKKQLNDANTTMPPLKRSSRRSNDSNQSVLKSAIARKERTFSIDPSPKKKIPKKLKLEPKVTNEVVAPVNTLQSTTKNKVEDIKKGKNDESTSDQKRKKKKLFRGGRYNIFKKKSLQKERQKNVKKSLRNQINSDSGHFDVDSSETNSERQSASVCSDIGTLKSSDKNYQKDMSNLSTIISNEDKMNDDIPDIEERDYQLCLCDSRIDVIIVDEGKISCKAEDCVDGKLIPCNKLAYIFDENGYMPMLRANVALPFATYCEHHMNRFFLHHCCPRCGKFCSEGVFMMCQNKHFSHIGCHRKDKSCLHCGVIEVDDIELRRHIIKPKKISRHKKNSLNITVEVGNVKLTTVDCPPEIDETELFKYLQQLKDEIVNPKRTMFSVLGLYKACETNDVKKFLSILGAECNLSYKFPSNHNRTGLHVAASQGNLMIVYLLLQAGVDPNLVDNKMKSPLRMAAKFGHTKILQYLLNFNGAPEIRDVQGMTSLHLAAKNGHLECCKIILSKRPSMVNWKDNGGWTPLVWACENSHVDIVKYFMTFNPNTRVPDEENNVALHWAAVSECLGVVKPLVEFDSEVNMFNDAGDTALHIAARKNASDIVSFLLEKGAMAWHKNEEKKRPIDYCVPGTKCHNLLKKIPQKQRKPVTFISPLVIPNKKSVALGSETSKTPVSIKTTPVLISDDISHGCEDVPIKCVNEIDDEIPIEFTYIKENCYDVGNHVDSAMSHIASCNCEGACNTNDCKCVQANGDCLYDENGCLNSDFDYFSPSAILYECNWRCRCHKQRCRNRVIQKGIKVTLELYKHKDMGWAVRTRQAIPRGTFVCEYIGEIITDQKANDLKEDSYLFNLENPGATELYCIDAYNYSNISRFINHSCDPNLMSVRSFINHHDKRFPRIAFFAVQDIKENEQLSYDYGTTFWKIKGGLFTCKCGKSNCSFSEETIKSLHIDSDNEELELDEIVEQIKTNKTKLCTNKLLNQDWVETNKSNSNSLKNKTKLSKPNNLSEQKTYLKKSNIIKIKPKNELLNMKKSNNIMLEKDEEKKKYMPKQLLKKADGHSTKILGSQLLKNDPQVVPNMLDKKLFDKTVKGNACRLPVNRKKSSVGTMEKNSICKDSKVIPELVKLSNNKAVTTYVLRPKTYPTHSSDSVFEEKRPVNVSSETLTLSQILNEEDSNDDFIDIIKQDPIYRYSESKLNIMNGGHQSNSSETLYISDAMNVTLIPLV